MERSECLVLNGLGLAERTLSRGGAWHWETVMQQSGTLLQPEMGDLD